MTRMLVVLIACAAFVPEAEAARTGLVCMAPTRPSDAGQPLSRLAEIEFYLDGGNPLAAYTVPLVLVETTMDADRHTVNAYAVSGGKAATTEIEFAGETPLTFSLEEIGETVATLDADREETASMADAIPGIACWRVELLEPGTRDRP